MLLVVGDEVIERETVVTRHKIHAYFRLTILVTVNLRAAKQPVGKVSHRTVIATEKAANIVAKPAIPFPPTVSDEISHLIKTGCIPSLSNKLRAREKGGRINIPKHWRAWRPQARPVLMADQNAILT